MVPAITTKISQPTRLQNILVGGVRGRKPYSFSHYYVLPFSKLFNSSVEVANHVRDTLITNLKDVISWKSNIVPPEPIFGLASQDHVVASSLPEWLQDHMVNSLSFWRSGFRVADGR